MVDISNIQGVLNKSLYMCYTHVTGLHYYQCLRYAKCTFITVHKMRVVPVSSRLYILQGVSEWKVNILLGKNVYVNVCLILDGYRDIALSDWWSLSLATKIS